MGIVNKMPHTGPATTQLLKRSVLNAGTKSDFVPGIQEENNVNGLLWIHFS